MKFRARCAFIMRAAVEQSTSERNEDGEKEKRKKRRSNRRSKQTQTASITTAGTVLSNMFCLNLILIRGLLPDFLSTAWEVDC